MQKSGQLDVTQGSLIQKIMIYSIPLIISTIIQNLFGAIDLLVLGQMADTAAIASVGATSSIISLVVHSFFGIAAGTRIVLAYQLGQNDAVRLRRTVDTSMLFSVLIGVVVAIVGVFFAPILLEWTSCPADCMAGATTYVRVYIIAAPAVLLYNFGSAILMTAGDTRRPLYYMFACSLLNVMLNVLLCLILADKVLAVAIATAASQILGATLVLIRLTRMDGPLRVHLSKMRIHWRTLGKLLRYGLPVALTGSLYPIAGLQIQSAVNSLGAAAIAGNSAASTLETTVVAFSAGFTGAVGTFVGQNLGANKPERVRASIFHALWLSVTSAIVVGIAVCTVGRFVLMLLLGGDAEAVDYAMIRVFWLGLFQFIYAMADLFGCTVQAFGYPSFSSAVSLAWVLGFRVIWMLFVYPHFAPSYTCLILCFFVSWFGMLICNGVGYVVVARRYRKGRLKRI